MNNEKREQQKSPAKRFLFILGLVMFTLYFLLGVVIIAWQDFPLALSTNYRIAFGLLLILYSSIRFRRLLRK